MIARLVVAISFIMLVFTAVDAFAFSSGSRRRHGGEASVTSTSSSTNSTTNSVVQAPEPTSLYAIASGVLLLGGAAWLVRRK